MPPAELDARRIVCQISKMFRQISIVSDCGALYYIFRIVVEPNSSEALRGSSQGRLSMAITETNEGLEKEG